MVLVPSQLFILPMVDLDQRGHGIRLSYEIALGTVFLDYLQELEYRLLYWRQGWFVAVLQTELVGHVREHRVVQIGSVAVQVVKSDIFLGLALTENAFHIPALSVRAQ